MAQSTAEPMAQRKQSQRDCFNSSSTRGNTILERVTYGVPSSRRMLTPGLLLKKHDLIVHYLKSIGLTTADRDTAFYLLRLFAYYGKVYPKAPNYTEDCYRSKRSFWRTVAKLEELGFVDRINRYLNHLQISNCYRLDKLVLCLARYLAEHGYQFLDKFTQDIIHETAKAFWRTIHSLRVRLRDPIPLTLDA